MTISDLPYFRGIACRSAVLIRTSCSRSATDSIDIPAHRKTRSNPRIDFAVCEGSRSAAAIKRKTNAFEAFACNKKLVNEQSSTPKTLPLQTTGEAAAEWPRLYGAYRSERSGRSPPFGAKKHE